MRLFVALEIPAAVRENLAALIQELRSLSASLHDKRPRWVRAENLHVTLKFIGEASPEKLHGICGALSAVRSDQACALIFRGVGFFPSEKHARVFWAGIEASPNLSPLAADIDGALQGVGIAREKRPFAPHLTLARFEPPGMQGELRSEIQKNIAREFGSLRTNEFHLIESKTKPSGAEYTTLQSFRFASGD